MSGLLVRVAVCCLIAANSFAANTPQGARKFAEFGNICCEDEKARLDNFVHQLRNDPEARGYIIFYGGRRYRHPYCHSSRISIPRRGEAEARAARMKPYIVNLGRIDPARIVVINGGYREEWMAELWIVPPGAAAPIPSPTIDPREIRFRRGRATARQYYGQCNAV